MNFIRSVSFLCLIVASLQATQGNDYNPSSTDQVGKIKTIDLNVVRKSKLLHRIPVQHPLLYLAMALAVHETVLLTSANIGLPTDT